MRIIRFIDDAGSKRCGLESDSDQAELLVGDLYQGLEPSGGPWESYLTDPGSTPDPADWRTEVCLPGG